MTTDVSNGQQPTSEQVSGGRAAGTAATGAPADPSAVRPTKSATPMRSVVVTVSRVVAETDDARSLVFEIPTEHRAAFDYAPGQFLTLRVPSDRTGSVARCYSLASSPFTGEPPKVTVKRTEGGYASHWLCDNVVAGDPIEVLPPAGTFTPANLDDDLLLFAAGSGITPIISIVKSALCRGSGKVTLVYANRDEKSVIFARELRELTDRYSDRLTVAHWLESVQGLPTAARLTALLTAFPECRIFLCGPAPFMASVRDAAARSGIPRNRVHAEVFTSLSGDPFADMVLPVAEEEPGVAATVSVGLDGVGHALRWPRSATLVDVLLAAGLQVPFSCREGECGSCACVLTEGKVDMGNAAILDDEDIAAGYILACQARPISDNLSVEF